MALVTVRFGNSARLRSAAENSPPMKKGEKGEAVAILQEGLIELGGLPMPVTTAGGSKAADGIYGDETTRTVLKFQQHEGLQPDGVAGRQTLHRLDQLEQRRIQALLLTIPDIRQWSVTTARPLV